jgi:hypothetical protein
MPFSHAGSRDTGKPRVDRADRQAGGATRCTSIAHLLPRPSCPCHSFSTRSETSRRIGCRLAHRFPMPNSTTTCAAHRPLDPSRTATCATIQKTSSSPGAKPQPLSRLFHAPFLRAAQSRPRKKPWRTDNRKRLLRRVSPVQFRVFKLLPALSPPCPSFPTLRRSRRP